METGFNVDVTTMTTGIAVESKRLETAWGQDKFDHLMFNFPEIPDTQRLAEEDAQTEQECNIHLLRSFFRQAKKMLSRDGEVHVTLRDSIFCRRWKVHELAAELDLELVHLLPFQSAAWPGYRPVRNGWRDVIPSETLQDAYTFTFAFKNRRRPSAVARMYSICFAQQLQLVDISTTHFNVLLHLNDFDVGNVLREFRMQRPDRNTANSCLEAILGQSRLSADGPPSATLWPVSGAE